ncbi:hypothetical protein LBMAG27_09460 [Bacteroidota bacterium]|nr:hypothetical protein LBMAG27_09460 [Bacteroidota bacterium]
MMKKIKQIKNPYIIIIILWLCSVAIRVPQLNRPLSKHHEFVTAHVMRTMKIWNQQGGAHFNFNPVMSYECKENKFINNQTTENYDSDGNSYYLSYPPLAYMLPYFVLGGWMNAPTVLSLQLFNMLLHLIECFLLYQICLLLMPRFVSSRTEINKIGIVAVLVNLFSPCLLWFHGNAYFTDMPALTFFLLNIWLWLKYAEEKKALMLLVFFISSFLFSYTEYFGVTYAIVIFIYSLFNRKYFLRAISICAGSVSAIALMLYQYSLISGWEKLMEFMQLRYAVRGASPHSSITHFLLSWKIIAMNYLTGFTPWVLLLVILIFINRKKIFGSKIFSSENFRAGTNSFNEIFILLLAPVLLHHILFLNATGHDFQQMKASPFLAITIAIGFVPVKKNWMKIIFSIALVTNIFLFYLINPPGKISLTGDSYKVFLQEGKFIHENASDDEVVFLNGILDEPQLVWYSQRNLRTIRSTDDAINFLKQHNLRKGIIFTFDRKQIIRVEQHIELTH